MLMYSQLCIVFDGVRDAGEPSLEVLDARCRMTPDCYESIRTKRRRFASLKCGRCLALPGAQAGYVML